MTVLGLPRRCACAAVALMTAGLLFHGSLAEAVVTRGDDALRNGDVATAVRSYRKALALDPGSTLAADRLAFQLALLHHPDAAASAIAVASSALRAHPHTAALVADRGFGELVLHAWQPASVDFADAAALARDPRYAYLTARLALRSGDRARARRSLRQALRDDPAFAPAASLLRRLP